MTTKVSPAYDGQLIEGLMRIVERRMSLPDSFPCAYCEGYGGTPSTSDPNSITRKCGHCRAGRVTLTELGRQEEEIEKTWVGQ